MTGVDLTMRIRGCNWMQIEQYLKRDVRAVLPLGCTEQHAYLSLAVDSILSEHVALDAAEPLGIPVFPVIPYGPTASFMACPGTVSLQLKNYLASRTPQQARDLLGDGNFGGDYQKPDDVMDGLWKVAVSETREPLQGPWQKDRFAPHRR